MSEKTLCARKSLDFLNKEFLRENCKKPSFSEFDTISSARADRIFASKGTEPSHPFLDSVLVNYMPTLLSDAKIRWGTRGYLVRQIAKRFVPESIRKCKRKFGTAIPLTGWLIAGKDYIEEILDSVEFSERGYNVENIRHTYKKVRPAI